MGWLRVRKWEAHQHYKDRRPAWIKLHAAVLQDYEFTRLPDATKAHLVSLWILASRENGWVVDDAQWIATRIGATEPVNLQVLVAQGFLVRAHRKQSASTSVAKRTARREENIQKRREECSEDTDAFENAWAAYPKRPANSRSKALRAWQARLAGGEVPERMLQGVHAYAAYVVRDGTAPKFIKLAATFFGPDQPYLDDYGEIAETVPTSYEADGVTYTAEYKAYLSRHGLPVPA